MRMIEGKAHVGGVTGPVAKPYRGTGGVTRRGFSAVWKHHYTRLPDMPRDLAPAPYNNASKRAIGVFLIFERFEDRTETHIEDWLVKSACWARRSWIHNTDAIARNIPLKFYVEEAVRHRVRGIFMNFGVDPSDVIWFDGSAVRETHEQHFSGRGGKQAIIFSDKQFAEYEWVLQIDADMFMARPPGCEGVYPFFAFFEERTKALSHFACVHLHGVKKIADMRWPVQIPSGDREAWCKVASDLICESVRLGSEFRGLSAAITAFRAKHLHRNHSERLTWMTEAGRQLQSDEAMFSLLDFIGTPVWGMMNQMRLSGVWGVDELDRVREQGEFYLSHMGLPQEWDWRADIGVDDE